MRSTPPRRSDAAAAHHSASAGSWAPLPTSSCSKFAAMPFQPLSSHMFTTCGHAPVEPTVAHTPKQLMLRSRLPTGHQFAVMWCMYFARLCPMMSMNSWMYSLRFTRVLVRLQVVDVGVGAGD